MNSFDLRLYRHAACDGALVGWFAELAAICSPFGADRSRAGHPPEMTAPSEASTKAREG